MGLRGAVCFTWLDHSHRNNEIDTRMTLLTFLFIKLKESNKATFMYVLASMTALLQVRKVYLISNATL